MNKVWILTSEYNEYDQHGEYFIRAFKDKPSFQELKKLLKLENQSVDKETLKHILTGGGRRYEGGNLDLRDHFVWYYLREEELC